MCSRTTGLRCFCKTIDLHLSYDHQCNSGVRHISTVEFKKKGNKQIALRVEPELEVGIQKALSMDGDASISAWIKRIIRKELKQKGIEV